MKEDLKRIFTEKKRIAALLLAFLMVVICFWQIDVGTLHTKAEEADGYKVSAAFGTDGKKYNTPDETDGYAYANSDITFQIGKTGTQEYQYEYVYCKNSEVDSEELTWNPVENNEVIVSPEVAAEGIDTIMFRAYYTDDSGERVDATQKKICQLQFDTAIPEFSVGAYTKDEEGNYTVPYSGLDANGDKVWTNSDVQMGIIESGVTCSSGVTYYYCDASAATEEWKELADGVLEITDTAENNAGISYKLKAVNGAGTESEVKEFTAYIDKVQPDIFLKYENLSKWFVKVELTIVNQAANQSKVWVQYCTFDKKVEDMNCIPEDKWNRVDTPLQDGTTYIINSKDYYYFRLISETGMKSEPQEFQTSHIDDKQPVIAVDIYKGSLGEKVTLANDSNMIWTNDDLAFSVSNNTANESGTLFTVQYNNTTIEGTKESGSNYKYKLAYDVLTAEKKAISFDAVSGAGCSGDTVSYTIGKDNTAPEIIGYSIINTDDKASADAVNVDGVNWYNKNISIVIANPQEENAAPNSVYYAVVDAAAGQDAENKLECAASVGTDENVAINLTESTKWAFTYYRKDEAGNKSDNADVVEIGVDTVTPDVSLQLADGVEKDWYNKDVKFVTSFDKPLSDVSECYYEYQILDAGGNAAGEWTRGTDVAYEKNANKVTGQFTVDAETIQGLGTPQTIYKVRAVAVSKAGNTGYSNEFTIHEDTQVPEEVEYEIQGTAVNGWYNGNANNANNCPVVLLKSGQDEGSPITYTAMIDGVWTDSAETFEVPNGTHTITFVAKDAAGNEKKKTFTIKVDNQSPEIQVTKSHLPNQLGWYNNDVTYHLSDQGNQLSALAYSYRYKTGQMSEWSDWKSISGKSITLSQTLIEGLGVNTVSYKVQFKAVSGSGIETVSAVEKVNEDTVTPSNIAFHTGKTTNKNGWYNNKQLGNAAKLKLKVDKNAIGNGNDGGSPVTAYYILSKDGTVMQNGTLEGMTYTVSGDGRWTMEYYTRDDAGNESAHSSNTYNIDVTAPQAPEISFETVNTSTAAHILNFLTFRHFFREEVKVTVTTKGDNLSGLDKLTYWTTENGVESKKVSVGKKKTTFTLPAGFKGTVSAYAVDKAGNQTETMTSDGVVYENIGAEITIHASADNNAWQNKNVSFHVITQDTESGLRKVTYTLNGNVVYEKDFTAGADMTCMDQADIVADAEAVDAAGYTLDISVVDNAGNESSQTEHVYIDKTAPVISLSGVEAGSFSSQTQNLNVEVQEAIYNYDNVTVTATRTLDGVTENYPLAGFTSDKVTSGQTYAFSEDGTYVVTVSAVDAAGNVAETKQITFTVDKTAPVITLNGVEEGSYSASGVTANLNIVESYYENDEVTVTVTKTLDGATGSYNAGTWKNTGKVSEMSMDFNEDGTYLIEVSAQDAAGNAAVSQQLGFTVDMTAPEVSIGGADDYYISGNEISLTYAVTESYFDTDNVSIDVTREDAAGNVSDVSVGTFNSSGKESSLTYNFSEDGIYTSTLTATDKAGNESTVKKTVTVDTTSPVIRYVDEIDGKYYQKFSLDHSIEDMVEDVTVPTYDMTLNGEEYDGVTVVTEEGKYVFKMDVSDEVGHTAYASAEFIVDNTAPVVVITGAEDGMVSYDNVEYTVSLSENDDIMQGISVGGEAQSFDEENNTYSGRLTKTGAYDIEVKAVDFAGNETAQTIHITIADKSLFRKWFDHKPVFAASVVCMGGAVGAGGYAMHVRKRKRIR